MVSLCNLHPNTTLHISIFIHFGEAYLGILPHFNLFHHLFWLKKRGGGGSKVVGGVTFICTMGWRASTLLCR